LKNKFDFLANHVKAVNNTVLSVFEQVSSHLNVIEKKINVLDAKINALEGNTTTGFGKVDFKLDDLKSEIQKINTVTSYSDIFHNQQPFSSPQKGDA